MTFSTDVKGFFGLIASIFLAGSEAVTGLDVINLPDGFVPGGITSGGGWKVYVGSIAGDNTHVHTISKCIAVAVPLVLCKFREQYRRDNRVPSLQRHPDS